MLDGGAGDDVIHVEGDDRVIWNPGDGNDIIAGAFDRAVADFGNAGLDEVTITNVMSPTLGRRGLWFAFDTGETVFIEGDPGDRGQGYVFGGATLSTHHDWQADTLKRGWAMTWKINPFFARVPAFGFICRRLVLLVAALISANQSFAADYDAYASSVIAYGVKTKKVDVGARDGSKIRAEEERCIFIPMFHRGARLPNDYRGWSISSDSTKKYSLPHLQNLKSYVVLNEDGAKTDIQYNSFDLVWNGYPNYFAGSPIPKQGCGALLLAADIKQPKGAGLVNSDLFLSMLEQHEREMLKSAMCSDAARKVVSPKNALFDCESILENVDLSKKSLVRWMFDGTDYYLVRSYAQPRSLFMFKVDFEHTKLIPMPAFVGVGEGEQYLHLEYFMSADLDGDGVSEAIVRQKGWEWSGFAYLKKQDGYWK